MMNYKELEYVVDALDERMKGHIDLAIRKVRLSQELPEYLTPTQAAKHLGCNPQTIYNKIRKGVIKIHVVAGSKKIKTVDII